MPDARKAAVLALMAIDKDGSYSNIAADAAIKKASLSGADAALCSALIYGVLDRRNTIDHIIKANSSKPVEKLDAYVHQVLRISVLQLKYMDKIPGFAAVNEAVRLIKQSKNRYAAGFVNAVLRSVQRDGARLPDGDDFKSLSVTLSCDEGIIKRLFYDYGAETAKRILAPTGQVPPVFLRVNRLKCTAEQLIADLGRDSVTASKVEQMPDAVAARGAVERTQAYKNGWFHVQDISCQKACEALEAAPGMRVLDVCAAPGGKSFTVAVIMKGDGAVVARDIHPHRVRLIESGAKRLGLNNVTASVGDGSVFDSSLGCFDRVLCDVPCSGIGVIARKPDIRYKPADLFDRLKPLQYGILSMSCRYVSPGGVLVYSTCTLLKAENEEIFERFLKEHNEFEPMPFSDGSYMRTILPEGGGDGFFFARARRKN